MDESPGAPPPTPTPTLSPKARALVAAVALAPYLVSLTGPFVFDDVFDIAENPANHAVWPPGWAASSRPLVALTFALCWMAGGGATWPFHLGNVLVHVGTALALQSLVWRGAALPHLPLRVRQGAASLATWTAALWAVHPLHTSAVSYVVHRYESMCSLFYVLAVLAFVRACEPGARRVPWAAALGASALAAGLSKEVAVTLPVSLLLVDLALVSRSLRGLARNAALHAVAVAGCVVSIGYALRPRDVNSSQGLHLTQLTPFDYALTQLGVIARYLRLVVWPSGLSFDYFDWPVARSLADVMPGALVTFAALGATAVLLARRPALGLVGAWFFVLLAPTSTVLPLAGELVAERRMYLALAAPALFAAFALLHLRERSSRLATGAGSAAVVLFAVVTARHNLAYRTAVGIFGDAVAARPHNVRARYNYGNALKDEGRIDLALAEYRECMARDVGYMDAYTNAVVAGQRLGLRNPWEGEEPAADAEQEEARVRPLFARSERAFGQGRRDEAVELLREATRLAPTSIEAHSRLAYVLVLAPDPLLRDGTEGLRAALRAWALNRSLFDPMTGTIVAAAYAELGRFDDALRVTAQLTAFLERAGLAPLLAEQRRLGARYLRHERWTPP